MEDFEKYAIASPGDANPFDSMGDLYFMMGRIDEAIEKCKAAVDVKPDFGSDLKLAYLYALKENYSEAMKWIDQYISVAHSAGEKAEGYVCKGFYNFWLGHIDQAREDAWRAQELAKSVDHKMAEAYADWIRAWVAYYKAEFELSQKYFKNWLENIRLHKSPWTERPCAYYPAEYSFYLGLISLKQGQIDSTESKLLEMKSHMSVMKPNSQFWATSCNYGLFHGEILLVKDSTEKMIAFHQQA